MRVYGDVFSGNCYKIKLLMSHLKIKHKWVVIDTMKKETHTPEFLAKNPAGQIPILELDDGTVLPESGAILYYFAEGTPFLPTDRLERARVLQWMFYEQYCHEPYVATARAIVRYRGRPPELEEKLQSKFVPGYEALTVMENHLAKNQYFVANRYSIADIALYAYTHVAEEGLFDLSRFPAVNAWIARVAAQPGYVRMAD